MTELAAAMRQRCGELALTAGEIKLFGFVSGGLGGMWFPAVDFVIAGTFWITTFATVSSLLSRFSR